MYKVWVLYYLLRIMMISQTGLDASSSLRKIKGKKIGQIAAVHPRPSTQVGNTAQGRAPSTGRRIGLFR